MSRGMRLGLMLLILIAVIAGMMDCAKKTMRKKQVREEGDAGQSWHREPPPWPLPARKGS